MKITLMVVPVLLLTFRLGFSQPISQHPRNPHYFYYKNKPMVLVTSAEHYGAIINQDFDFEKYLTTLHKLGLNHTRVFLGDYVEGPGSFCIETNTLAPEPGKFLAPWNRSAITGFSLGGNKFDLEKWNDAYFKRAHAFFSLAQDLDIIVEAVLFFEGPTLQNSPMHVSNNINNTSDIQLGQYLTLRNGNILGFQEKYCRKMIHEFNVYDNIIFNVCNEPWFNNHEIPGFSSPTSDEVKDWIYRVTEWITDQEKFLPKKHLLSVDYTNEGKPISNEHLLSHFKHIKVFNHHYDRDALSITHNYHQPIILSFNETGLMPVYSSEYRTQAWKYLLQGGALYNNLDFTFLTGFEDGNGEAKFSCAWYNGCGDPEVKNQLAILLNFMNSIHFEKMQPNRTIMDVYYGDKQIFPMVWEGNVYAFYILGGKKASIGLQIPKGSYGLTWISPETGELLSSETVDHPGGSFRLISPEYTEDIAAKLIKQ